MRLVLLLSLALTAPSFAQAVQPATKIVIGGALGEAIRINESGEDPTELLKARLLAQSSGNPQIQGGGGNNPEAQRLRLLRQLVIDRSPSGILQARVQATRPPEPQADPDEQANPETSFPPGLSPEQIEARKKQLEKQQALKEKIKGYQDEINTFRIDVILGNWDQVRAYLDALPEATAKQTFSRVLSQLASPVNVQPLPELAAVGASAHKQQQYLRPTEVLSLSDASKTEPDSAMLGQLAALIPTENPPPPAFFALLESGTRYFGKKDPASSQRTAELLLNAGLLKESKEYLPEVSVAREAKNIAGLNLLARYHAESHKLEASQDHLATSWALCTEIMGNPEAPLQERGSALYRALSLVPDLESKTGTNWLEKTFSHTQGEGFEILAAVGTLAAQSRQIRNAPFRLEQLKLQAAATKALLATNQDDLSAWSETLTLYTLNWIHEAQQSYRLDQNTSIRQNMQVDNFGNVYYKQNRTAYEGRGIPPIAAVDLVACMPDDQWLSHVDEPVRLDCLERMARLFLKVKEEERAFPVLKQLAKSRPESTEKLVSEMISVWSQNHNPNQQSRYRSSYFYFYGFNQRAETIPLTRSKQERNLKELAKLVQGVRELQLEESFEQEFSDAFIQAHSQAEVWRVEALHAVFGDLNALAPKSLAALLRRMRTNLANLWPNPKIQQQAKTNRTDKELQQHILKGYTAATQIATEALARHPDDWRMQIQLASLRYEEINYRSTITRNKETSTTKRSSLNDLAAAAADYAATLPLEKESEESIDAYETWFYAALGSPDLGALKAHHQPIPSEYAKIKAALASLPAECLERHLDRFATTLNNRLANVSPDLKFRYLEAALQITGPHEQIQNATDVFQYYQDLVTEIQLASSIDGPDQISADTPFGLFVNLRHTQEIERESGGFQRYLQNQSNNQFGYNYGRNTENYRDKFEKSVRAALEEHFDIQSITFHTSKIESRSDPEYGWRVTPYAYLLLQPKGPEVDTIPPLKMDLDFLDTSGYVVLPVTSSSIPIDASGNAALRPVRDLTVTLTLDERDALDENAIHLDVKASGLGLVPSLENLLDMNLEGFVIADTEDRELLIEELDAESEDGAPRSVREWRLSLTPAAGASPTSFTFPTVKVPVKEEDGLTLQRYDDVDLLVVPSTVPLGTRVGPILPLWGLLSLVFTAVVLIVGAVLFARRSKPLEVTDQGPAIPETLTPVTLLSFLERLHERLPSDKQSELSSEIQALQSRFFGPHKDESTPDLRSLATRWKEAAS